VNEWVNSSRAAAGGEDGWSLIEVAALLGEDKATEIFTMLRELKEAALAGLRFLATAVFRIALLVVFGNLIWHSWALINPSAAVDREKLLGLLNFWCLLLGLTWATQSTLHRRPSPAGIPPAGTAAQARPHTDTEKDTIAAHEAGHLAASWFHPDGWQPQRLTLANTATLDYAGCVEYDPAPNSLTPSRPLFSYIVATMAGLVAEQLLLHDTSTGATHDIDLSRGYAEWLVGARAFNRSGRRWRSVDEVLDAAQQAADELLSPHRDQLQALAEALRDRIPTTGRAWIDGHPLTDLLHTHLGPPAWAKARTARRG
jgi:hypothetical protein